VVATGGAPTGGDREGRLSFFPRTSPSRLQLKPHDPGLEYLGLDQVQLPQARQSSEQGRPLADDRRVEVEVILVDQVQLGEGLGPPTMARSFPGCCFSRAISFEMSPTTEISAELGQSTDFRVVENTTFFAESVNLENLFSNSELEALVASGGQTFFHSS
jgi:hypothetical protein